MENRLCEKVDKGVAEGDRATEVIETDYKERAALVQEDGAFKAFQEVPILLDFLKDVWRMRVHHPNSVIRILINAGSGYQPSD